MAALEHLLISKIIDDAEITPLIDAEIGPDSFSGEWSDIYKWVLNYYDEYRQVPSARAFGQAYGDVDITDTSAETFTGLIDELHEANKFKHLATSSAQVVEHLNNGDVDKAFAVFSDVVSDVGTKKSSSSHNLATFDWAKFGQSEDLVDGLVGQGESFLLHGDSGTFKSFLAIDMALSIATGTPFFGRQTMKGAFHYVSMEGGAHEFAKRSSGWLNDRGLTPSPLMSFDTDPCYMLKPESVRALINKVRDLEDTTGERVRLVVIDTLSKAIPGHDENSQDTGSLFTDHVDMIVRETGASVLIVHHNNKGPDTRHKYRGSTTFGANMDGRLSVWKNKEGFHVMDNQQRSRAEAESMHYSHREVSFTDSVGTVHDTIVLQELDGTWTPESELDNSIQQGADICTDYYKEHGKPITVRAFAEAADVSIGTGQKRLKNLHELGYIDASNVPNPLSLNDNWKNWEVSK